MWKPPNPELPSRGRRGLQGLFSAAVDSTVGSGSGSGEQETDRHPGGIARVTNKEEKEGTSSGACRTQWGLESAWCPRLRRLPFPEARLWRWVLLSSASPLWLPAFSPNPCLAPVGKHWPRKQVTPIALGSVWAADLLMLRKDRVWSFFCLQAGLNSLPFGQRCQKEGSKDFLATSLCQNCRGQVFPVSYLRTLMPQSLPSEGPQGYLAPSLLLEKSFSSSDLKWHNTPSWVWDSRGQWVVSGLCGHHYLLDTC